MKYLFLILLFAYGANAQESDCVYALVDSNIASQGTIADATACQTYADELNAGDSGSRTVTTIGNAGFPQGCIVTDTGSAVYFNTGASSYGNCNVQGVKCIELDCTVTDCRDPDASNYNAQADTADNTLCRYNYLCPTGTPTTGVTPDKDNRDSCQSCNTNYVLDGQACKEDMNNNGIADDDEIEGCMTEGANNYNANANVATTCTYDYTCDREGFDANPCGCATEPNQIECLGKDDYYIAQDPTLNPELDLVWRTEDIDCGDGNFVTLSQDPGLDKFACMDCTKTDDTGGRLGFLVEYSSLRQRNGKYDHGRCCVNGHHKVCQQLLNSYKSNCVDTDKGHVDNRACA